MPQQTLQIIEKRIHALLSQAKRLKRKKLPALRQVVRLVRGHSISIGEIRTALAEGGKGKKTTARKTRRASGKVAPKYRNPRTGATWSGRGRAARWLVAAEKAGRKRTEFLVKKN